MAGGWIRTEPASRKRKAVIAATVWLVTFAIVDMSGLAISFPSSVAPSRPKRQPVDQVQSAGNHPQVIQAFLSESKGPVRVSFRGTIISSNWALQSWSDDNAGGEALFFYSESQGWKLINAGGGAWNASGLASVGVPLPIAEKLISGRNWK